MSYGHDGSLSRRPTGLLTGLEDPGLLEADTAEQDEFVNLPVAYRSRDPLPVRRALPRPDTLGVRRAWSALNRRRRRQRAIDCSPARSTTRSGRLMPTTGCHKAGSRSEPSIGQCLRKTGPVENSRGRARIPLTRAFLPLYTPIDNRCLDKQSNQNSSPALSRCSS